MISQKLVEKVLEFTEAIQKEEELILVLEALSSIYNSTDQKLKNILTPSIQGDHQAALKAIERTKSAISSDTHNAIRKSKFSTTTLAVEKIKNSVHLDILDRVYGISKNIDFFMENFDQYLHAPSMETSLSLTESAHKLLSSLYEIQSLQLSLQTIKTRPTTNPSLAIYLPEATSLLSFTTKISALTSLIDSCCRLLGMSLTEGEVSINKIESGSLFAEISANPLVVALATIIISKGTDYIFNQITPTKKGEALRDSSENLEKILGIRKFLTENGFNTSDIDEEIKKSSVSLAKQLSHLIGDQKEIEINNKKHTQHPLSISNTNNLAIENKATENHSLENDSE